MKVQSRQGITALAFAASAAAVLGAGVSARATVYTTSTSVDSLIETPSNFSGATRVTAEGETSGATSGFWDFALIDFNTSALLPVQTSVTAINSINLNLVDRIGAETSNFAVAGTVDVYITNYTGTSTALTYQTAPGSQPSGIGTQLSNGTSTLFSVGQISYLATAATLYNTTLSISNTTLLSYLTSQINNGSTIRLVIADHASGTAADFEGSSGLTGTPSLAPPGLSLDLTTTTATASNSTLTITPKTGGNANATVIGTSTANSLTFHFNRILGTVATNITVTNTGSDPGRYILLNSTAGPGATQASSTSAVGTDPIPAGGTANITASIVGTSILAGSATAASPATTTVTLRDQGNAADPTSTITIVADQVVTTRLIDNAGATAAPLQFGKILGGATTSNQTATLDTENTNSLDYSSNSLTTLTLANNTTNANHSLTTSPTGTNDTAVATALANATFDSGGATGTASVNFTGGTVGGLYQSNSFYEGYVSLTLAKGANETALGAGGSTARIYMEADVYQPALVTGGSTANNTYSLTNAPHTANVVNTALGDIGARSNATVTSVGTLVAQTGWSSSFTAGGTINDGQTVQVASFDPTAKWNGVYHGTLPVGLQNDLSITGAHANDLGTTNFALTTTVAGNSGNASVNVLPGGSFAGYSIPRGSGANSTVALLGGTSAAGTTVSVSWANGTSSMALSDRATLTKAGSDLYVVQMTYSPTAITGGAANSPELAYSNANGTNVLATFGNSDGGSSANETIGAFSGTPTLGQYGFDPVANTVWAVVDHVGAFEAFQRKLGDATGDGSVDLNDLNTVLNNLGVVTALWSHGNFDGATAIDLNDLNDVLNNLGTSLPVGANSVAIAQEMLEGFTPDSPIPEPTTLGLAGFGVAGLLLRRKNRAKR